MALGKIRWFSNPLGYGFIERDDGQSFYVHYTDINEKDPARIKPGERVEFEIQERPLGPQARHVNHV